MPDHGALADKPKPSFCSGVDTGRLLGHPIPAEGSALLTVGPPAKRPDLDGVTAFRTHELRPGWVPPIPRGQWCSPGRVASPTGTRRFPAAVPLPRNNIPPCEASHHEASTGVQSRSPVRSSPRPRPRGGTGSASASPELRTPPSPAAHVRGGDRPSSTDLEQRFTTSAEPPILRVHSMRATSRRTANCETRAVDDARPAFVLARVCKVVPPLAAAFVRFRQPAEVVSPSIRWLLLVGGGCVVIGVLRLARCLQRPRSWLPRPADTRRVRP